MDDAERRLEELLRAEREACARYDRLAGPMVAVNDNAVLQAARDLCDEARRQVEQFKAQHPELRQRGR